MSAGGSTPPLPLSDGGMELWRPLLAEEAYDKIMRISVGLCIVVKGFHDRTQNLLRILKSSNESVFRIIVSLLMDI